MAAWFVEQRRGSTVEARHRVHACATGPDGSVLWQVGDDLVSTFRSAAKPFQLEASLALLPASLRGALSTADLALGSASHHGQPEHIAQLTRLLAALGCRRDQLYCGAHEPSHPESARALWKSGQLPDVLHNNCAGKHMFMAAACLANGYPADYRPRAHPLQQAVATLLEQRCQQPVTSVVDGCGVPCFVAPLSRMARCYAQLARAMAADDGSTLCAIGQALTAEPFLMSGTNGFDGWLNAHIGAAARGFTRERRLLAKVGALGLLCLSLPEQGIGIAMKVESGSELARPAAAHALLQHFHPGLITDALPEQFWAVENVVGARVGELVCTH